MTIKSLIESTVPRPTLADAVYQIFCGIPKCLNHRMDRYTYSIGYAISLVPTIIGILNPLDEYYSNNPKVYFTLPLFLVAFVILGGCLCRRCNDSGINWVLPILPYAIGILMYAWYFLYDIHRLNSVTQFASIGYMLITICSIALPLAWLFLPPRVNSYNQNMLYLIASNPAPRGFYVIMRYDEHTEFIRRAFGVTRPK